MVEDAVAGELEMCPREKPREEVWRELVRVDEWDPYGAVRAFRHLLESRRATDRGRELGAFRRGAVVWHGERVGASIGGHGVRRMRVGGRGSLAVALESLCAHLCVDNAGLLVSERCTTEGKRDGGVEPKYVAEVDVRLVGGALAVIVARELDAQLSGAPDVEPCVFGK